MSKLQIEDIHPLSPLQQGMLFHDLYEPERRTYSQQVSCTLSGRLDGAALERAWRLLLERHTALRAGFLWKRKEEPLQVVYRGVALPWRALDWSDLEAAERERRLEELLAEEHGRGFDFATAPLMRLVLIRLAPETHQLVWTFHHLVMDGWSKSLVLQEVFALYESLAAGRTPALPPAVPFGRYIAWLRSQPLDAAEGFWRRYFEGWSGGGEGIATRGDGEGFGRATESFGAAATAELRELARGNQLTLNTLVQGAWALLLAGWEGGDDVVFGSTVSGRPADLEGVEGMVGLFINTLPTRVRVAPDAPLLPWLRSLQAEVLGTRQFEHTPLVRVHEWSGAAPGRPLFESIVVFESYPMQEGRAAGTGLVVSAPRGVEATSYPLALMAVPGDALSLSLLYDRSRVSPALAARLLAHLGELLRTMAREPEATLGGLSSLPAPERHQALLEWNDTAAGPPEGDCIHHLFAAQARRRPNALALMAGGESLTYSELDARADRLARALRALGVGPESLVGVALDRTAAMVVAVLGVLKAGGAYLPLDPAYPRERIDHMLRASGAAWVVTREEIAPGLGLPDGVRPVLVDAGGRLAGEPAEESGGEPAGATAASLAYVIFTSGSTGQPKGVQVTHAAVVNFLRSMARRPGLGPEDRLFAVTTLAFDIAGLEIFLPLSVGATVVLGGEAADGPALLADLAAAGCTALQATPSTWRLLLDSGWQGTSDLAVLCGGEPLPRDLADELLGRGEAVWNLYGPTETTIWSAVDEVAVEGAVTIGRPIDNTTIHLLDGDLRAVPSGAVGEIYIGGAGLARGYLGRPDLTAERFLPDPFAAAPGARVYRTGDLGRRLDDGRVEHLGRNDHQVKIRGYRIELGEVEAALRRHAAVRQAVVAAQPAPSGEPRLIGYVVTAGGEPVAAGELRAHLESLLPGYMVPSLFVSLDALPLTANGKVDRKALPAAEATRPRTGRDLVAPRTPVEHELARHWRELLGAAEVGIEDSFFELGGHSLLAIRLMARVREAFGVEVPLRLLLERPTVAGQAAAVARAKAEGMGELAAANAATALPTISADPARLHEPFPLTEVQQAYWVGRQGSFDLGNVAAHGYSELEVGALDVDRLSRVLRRLIGRHDMLRAVAHVDGTQQILAEVPPYEVELLDWRHLTAEEAGERAAGLRRLMSHQVHPADRWPLFDVRVARLAEDRHRIYLSCDLLMADAWSARILRRELAALYADPEAPLPPLAISFRDYVMAEAALQASEPYRKAESYWLGRLDTLPPAPELPLASRPDALGTPRFERRAGWLAPAAWWRLKRRAAQAGVTPSGILLSAFTEILAVWSKRRRFTVNLTTFNRLPLHPQVNDVVGDFTSLTLLEVDHSRPEPLELRARALQERLWEDLEHRHVGGVRVLRELARVRGRDTGTLMPVVFTSLLFETSLAEPAEEAAPPRRNGYGVSQTPQVWLDCQVSEAHGALAFNWDAVAGLFPPGMLDDMFGVYERLLALLADEPATWQEVRHPWVPAAQLALRAEINATAAPLSDERLHTLFDAQARRQPGRPAVIAPDRTLTYGELAAAANALAHRLVAAGASRGRLVAIVMEKGWEQAVAALAIVKAGAAYLPVDAALPADRLCQLLAQGEVELALTQGGAEARLEWPEGVRRLVVDDGAVAVGDPGAPDVQVEPGDLAYVIFTSGSTGVPKGVMIDHCGAVNTLLDVNERFGLTSDDRVLGLSSMSFDLSVYDVFGLLACGGALVLPPASAGRDPGVWLDAIERHGVTVWNSVPALMEMLLEVAGSTPGARLGGLRLVMLSGDWIPVHLPDRIREQAPRAQVVSLGGATEASIWSILHPIGEVDRAAPSIPYGRPMRNQTFAVLSEALDPCPTWVPGQLYIGGAGLSLGYWRDPEKTAARFPEAGGERLYWTGDLGRYLPDGEIEFLGREDFQVKIQGHRIELGEIEAALESHPAVRSAVAAAVGSGANGRRLVAYVVPRGREDAAGEAALPAGRLTAEALGRLLAALSPIDLEGFGFPKYRYPSASNLYPVQAYIGVPERTVEGLAAGVYYYHPRKHRLHRLRAGLPGEEAGAPPSLLLVGEIRAIYPLYGGLARDFSLLEAGYMGPVLTGAAAAERLGLRPSPRGGLAVWRDRLDLGESQLLLQAFQVVPGTMVTASPAHEEADELPESWDPASEWLPAAADPRGEAAAEAASGGVAVALAAPPVLLTDEVSRLEHRLRQPALRSFDAGTQAVALVRPEPVPELLAAYRERRTHRDFLTGPVAREAVLGLLAAAAPADGAAPPRMLLWCAPGGVAGLAAGTYGYDVGGEGLIPLTPGFRITPDLHVPVNRKPFEAAAFSIFLVAGEAGERSRDRGLLAAGAAAQRMMTAAPGLGLGLCPIGSFDFASVARACGLGADAVLLHSLVGGAVPRPAAAASEVDRGEVTGGLVEELLGYLRSRLPEYMVPARLGLLDALPLSSNGKVDRNALPALDLVPAAPESRSEAPETDLERQLADLWREVLKVERVGLYDNFFDLGGSSLHMVRFHRRLKEALGREIRITELFKHSTIRSLAELLAEEAAPAPAFTEAADRADRYREAMRRQRRPAPGRSRDED